VAEQLKLEFGALKLRERISAKARRIRIELRPDGEVHLVIPRRASRAQAWAFLQSRMGWVRRKLAEQPAPTLPAPLAFDGRDRLPLRGREYILELRPAPLRRPELRAGEDLCLLIPVDRLIDRSILYRALVDGLKGEARRDAVMLLDSEAGRLGVSYARLRLGDPRTLWGSCASDGGISLSWRLVMAPPEVFRYVVIHELCHLRYRSHGPRFWGLVERQMPGYEEARRWLRRHGQWLHRIFAAI
jgi:hypothetical protein